jgi:uncharacterized protein YcfJ
MNKILATTLAATLMMSTAAHAEYRRGYGGGWVAPLVGGMIIGGAIGAMSQPRYYDEVPSHTECRREAIYDRWGNFVGYERHCYRVPNY